MSANIKSLATFVLALMVSVSVSACSSTLAPEDDTTTEYVFEQASDDQVLAKDDKGRSDDNSEDLNRNIYTVGALYQRPESHDSPFDWSAEVAMVVTW